MIGHMKTLFLNQRGFSLVQGLIVSGILAGSGLVATKILNDQKKAQKTAESRDAIDQLHRQIYGTLQNRDHCTQTLVQGGYSTADLRNTIKSANATTAVTPKLRGIYTMTNFSQSTTQGVASTTTGTLMFEINEGATTSTFNANKTYINNSVIIKAMTLTYPLIGDATRIGMASLKIDYERFNKNEFIRTKEGFGGRIISKIMYLRIQKQQDLTATPWDNNIDGCYAVTESDGADAGNKDLSKDLCLQLNSQGDKNFGQSLFTWDDYLGACLPKNNTCTQAGYVNTGINSNGVAECRQLKDWTNIGNMMESNTSACTAGKTATLKYNSTTNKMYIQCL